MFLHAWAIPIGAVALSAPLVIHFLTRPKPVRMPLSTVRFVQEIVRQRSAHYRLRDWIILALRTVAIALLTLVLARPLFDRSVSPANADPTSTVVRLVILDVSQSMGAVAQGIQSLERARPIAARQVNDWSNTQANLILAAATPQPVFERPSTNFATLVDEVGKATPRPERLNAQQALNSAAEMFTNSGNAGRRELVIISDFQRANWAGVDFTVLPVDVVIQLESVAAAETPSNLAITRVGTPGRIERDRPFRVEVEIGNYSPSPRQVSAEVAIGKSQLRVQGSCPPGQRSVLVTDAKLTEVGWHSAEVLLTGIEDGIEADNHRSFVIEVHPQPTFLLLTRQSADARPSSSYFVERAIVSHSNTQGQMADKVVRVDPLRVDRDTLTAADLLVLDHPGKLSEETIQILSALLRRGRGLLYFAAEPIDATNLKLLAQTAGTSLQLPVEFQPAPIGQVRKNLFLADVRWREMPFRIFGEDVSAVVSPLRFGGGLASRRVEGSLSDDVIATYNDQSACLVVTACGAGTLAVLNAELGSSNLPASPAFVPMIGELTAHLLNRDRVYETFASGEPLAVYLPAAASPVAGLRLESSVSSLDPAMLGDLHEENVGVMWQAVAAGPPGIYQVKRQQQSVFALATAIPAEESDLVTIESELFKDRLSGGRHVTYRSAMDDDESRDEAWTWLAVGCLVFLFVEVLSLRLFKS